MHAQPVAVLALAGAVTATSQQPPKDELMEALARSEASELGRRSQPHEPKLGLAEAVVQPDGHQLAGRSDEMPTVIIKESTAEQGSPALVPELQANHHQQQGHAGCHVCGCQDPGCCNCPPPKASKTKVTQTHTITSCDHKKTDCPHHSKSWATAPKPTAPCPTGGKPGHGHNSTMPGGQKPKPPHMTNAPGQPGQPTHVPVNGGHSIVASGLGLAAAVAAAFFLL